MLHAFDCICQFRWRCTRSFRQYCSFVLNNVHLNKRLRLILLRFYGTDLKRLVRFNWLVQFCCCCCYCCCRDICKEKTNNTLIKIIAYNYSSFDRNWSFDRDFSIALDFSFSIFLFVVFLFANRTELSHFVMAQIQSS